MNGSDDIDELLLANDPAEEEFDASLDEQDALYEHHHY